MKGIGPLPVSFLEWQRAAQRIADAFTELRCPDCGKKVAWKLNPEPGSVGEASCAAAQAWSGDPIVCQWKGYCFRDYRGPIVILPSFNE